MQFHGNLCAAARKSLWRAFCNLSHLELWIAFSMPRQILTQAVLIVNGYVGKCKQSCFERTTVFWKTASGVKLSDIWSNMVQPFSVDQLGWVNQSSTAWPFMAISQAKLPTIFTTKVPQCSYPCRSFQAITRSCWQITLDVVLPLPRLHLVIWNWTSDANDPNRNKFCIAPDPTISCLTLSHS